MKIALFTDDFLPKIGGTEMAVFNLATALVANGHAVIVYAPRYPQANYKDFTFPVFQLPSFKINANNIYPKVTLSKTVLESINTFNPQIIHVHTTFNALKLAVKIGRQTNTPVLATMHTKLRMAFLKETKSKLITTCLLRNITKWLNQVDKVAVISKSMLDEVKSYGYQGLPHVFYNGVAVMPCSDNEYYSLRQEGLEYLKLTSFQGPIFSFLGRIERYKNITFILEALAHLKQLGLSLRMVFIGSGNDLKYYQAMTKRLFLTDEVIFVGSITDVKLKKALLATSSFFLFPSIFDNDPLVVAEAFSMRNIPVLLSKTGAAERFSNDNALLIESTSTSKEYAHAIMALINDPSKYEKLKKASNETYLPWSEVAKHYIESYQKIILMKQTK